ncbi:MAG: DegV family protein [Chloroflexota bacterium]|nr:DegV family protein [Chloroflexota bacterium]PLS78551.1 MAG: DegV family protein [Chloroflexota bacterium]
MPGVKIVTDSTADIPPALLRELEIEVVPLQITIGGETFRSGVDLTNEQFYKLLSEGQGPPSTTAPPTAVFEQTYRRLAQHYESIISVHISSHLSTAHKAAAQARERLPVSLARIEVIDSHSASMGLGLTVIAAARMAQAGVPIDEIVRHVHYRVQHTHSVFFVDTVEYLDRSGRVSMATNFASSMSRIKPLLLIDEGHIVPYERTRTRAKAIDGLFTFVEDFPNVREVAVMYSTSPEDVEKLLDKLMLIFPREQVLIAEYGPALGAHLGPGAMGVAAYEG